MLQEGSSLANHTLFMKMINKNFQATKGCQKEGKIITMIS